MTNIFENAISNIADMAPPEREARQPNPETAKKILRQKFTESAVKNLTVIKGGGEAPKGFSHMYQYGNLVLKTGRSPMVLYNPDKKRPVFGFKLDNTGAADLLATFIKMAEGDELDYALAATEFVRKLKVQKFITKENQQAAIAALYAAGYTSGDIPLADAHKMLHDKKLATLRRKS